VSSIMACTNSHPFDEESSDMNRWENDGGRPLNLKNSSAS